MAFTEQYIHNLDLDSSYIEDFADLADLNEEDHHEVDLVEDLTEFD